MVLVGVVVDGVCVCVFFVSFLGGALVGVRFRFGMSLGPAAPGVDVGDNVLCGGVRVVDVGDAVEGGGASVGDAVDVVTVSMLQLVVAMVVVLSFFVWVVLLLWVILYVFFSS